MLPPPVCNMALNPKNLNPKQYIHLEYNIASFTRRIVMYLR